MKPIVFEGDTLERLRAFPQTIRRQLGQQLDRIQHGGQPQDFKPMSTVGLGACEIRVCDESGVYRAIYVAKLADAVHVLHIFQKKTQQTSQQDIEQARRRYRLLMRQQEQTK